MAFGTYTGHVVVIADSIGQESVSDFPSENRRTFPFVFGDSLHYIGRGHSRFGATYCARFDGSCLVIPAIKPNASFVVRTHVPF